MLNRGRLAATAGVLFVAFQTSGIFPYHVVIATPDSEIALRGVVVVGQ